MTPIARRDAALGYDRMGETMANTGAISEGLKKLEMARSIYQELAASSPQSPARRDVASVDMVMGDILKTAHKNDDAVDNFRQALKITETLVAEDPKNTEYKRDLHNNTRASGRCALRCWQAARSAERNRASAAGAASDGGRAGRVRLRDLPIQLAPAYDAVPRSAGAGAGPPLR